MIKAYKIKRELLRILKQPLQWPSDLFTYLCGPKYYDLFLSRKCLVRSGHQDAGDKLVVYVMYPSKGVKASHLRTLQYLKAKKYSVLVVSNLPLAETDAQNILPLCHLCIERPNFGYDFGGYRQGVLAALGLNMPLQRLVLLNDSAWFPITDQTDWLDDVEALGVDFAAAASNFGVPRPDPEDFRNMVFSYRTDHYRFHYCSFALAFNSRPLRDPDFKKFWRNFPLTNKKKSTVRRGEVGLTAWILKKGFSHGSTFDVMSMEQSLNSLDDEVLEKVVRHLIVPEDQRMKTVLEDALEHLDALSRADRIKLVLTTIARQGVSYASAYFNITEKGFPFLKKSPMWLDTKSRDTTLLILDGLNTPEALKVKQEALEIAAK